jgi:hypothetical protein
VVDSVQVSAVVAGIFDDLRAADFVNLVAIAIPDATARVDQVTPGGAGGEPAVRPIVWDRYRAIDRRRFVGRADPDALTDIAAAIAGSEIRMIRGDTASSAPDGGMQAAIRSLDLDVAIDLRSRTSSVEMRDVARAGTWAFRYGSGLPRDHWPLVWSFLAGDPLIAVELLRLAVSSAGGEVLDRAIFATDPGSFTRMERRARFGSSFMVVRCLQRMHAGGSAANEAAPAPIHSARADRAGWGPPGAPDVLRRVVPLLARYAANKAAKLTRAGRIEHWRMAIRTPSRPLLGDGKLDMTGFRWVESPKGHFYADPFVINHDGRTWVFFEDYLYSAGRGEIACAEIWGDGRIGPVQTVLRDAGHLSYPNIFEADGSIYMIPEMASQGTVRLFRATSFPSEWQPVADLFAGSAVDTSVFRDSSRWWFFTTLREPQGLAPMLMLFHADELTGTWVSHPANPISTDVRAGRGAGAVIRIGDMIVRPSQDGSGSYGRSFSLNEIVTLTPDAYRERRLLTVDGGWEPGLLGTHTYNRTASAEVTDGKLVRRATDVM